MIQLITPNPNIPCQPGWCLQYVRQAFGLPARHPSATAAWEASESKHRDRNFPKGVWVPVWFSLANEPAGHVALMAPDGSVYSTSDYANVPHHHLDLSDLMNYYARYDMTLTYLGWTEDVAGYPVLTDGTIASQGTITPQSSTTEEDELTPDQMYELKRFIQDDNEKRHVATRNAITEELSKKIENSAYSVKVFTQATDNKNADRVILDNREVEAGK